MEVKRVFALIMGFLENVLFSGVCHGWPSMVYVLHEDGIFAHLCNEEQEKSSTNAVFPTTGTFVDKDLMVTNTNQNNTVFHTYSTFVTPLSNMTCPSRDRMLNLAYTLAVTSMMVGTVAIGKFFDRFGIFKLRLLASAFFIPGCLMLAFADRDRSWMIFPGIMLMSVAGACVIVTNYNVTLLGGSKRFTLASLYSGGTDIGIVVFFLVKLLWQAGMSRKVSLGILTGLWSIVLVDSIFLLPKFKVNLEEPSLRIDLKFPMAVHHDVPTLQECLSAPVYITHVIWISLLNLRMTCYFASFTPWITDITGGDTDRVSRMTNIFFCVMFCGILFNPLIGLTIDWCKKRLFTSTNDMSRNALAAMPVLYIHCVIVILLSIAVLIPREFFVYLSFFFTVVFRSGLYAIYYSFFNLVIPREYYGIMLGLSTSVAGVFTLIQFPLFIWAERSSLKFTAVNILLLVLSVLTLGHPSCICLMNRNKTSKNSAMEMTDNLSRAERLLGVRAQTSAKYTT